MKESDSSGQRIPLSYCRDLSAFAGMYFTPLHLVTNQPDRKSRGQSTIVIEPFDASGLINVNESRSCNDLDRESAWRPVSAPISPTMDTETKRSGYFTKAQSTGQACNSPNFIPSQISSTPTLQSVDPSVSFSKVWLSGIFHLHLRVYCYFPVAVSVSSEIHLGLFEMPIILSNVTNIMDVTVICLNTIAGLLIVRCFSFSGAFC